MKIINKEGFINMGFPYYGWLISIYSAIIKTSYNFDIPLIIYGENGEIEYGGSSDHKNVPIFGIDYLIKSFLEKGYVKVIESLKLKKEDLYWFELPDLKKLKLTNIAMTHWSYFENWDPYKNYIVAKENCGLQESTISNSSTFTNFAQTDQALFALHMYLCYLKFGFGRATQDAGIEIRRGSMTRDQAINLVKMYDGIYPEEFIDTYLKYFNINKNEFDNILDKWVNKNIFHKKEDLWEPKIDLFK